MKKLKINLFIFLIPYLMGAQWEKTSWQSESAINDIAISGDNVTVMNGNRLRISTDKGNTWTLKENELLGNRSPKILINNNYIFLYSWDQLLLSSDLGKSWSDITWKLSGKIWITKMLISDGKIFTATMDNGIYLSEDMGKSWEIVNEGLTNLSVRDMLIHDKTVILITNGGIFIAGNSGESWDYIESEISNVVGNDDVYLFGHKNSVFAYFDSWDWGGTSRFFKSEDGGYSWVEFLPEDKKAFKGSNYSFSSIGNALIISSHNGIYLSNDNGNTWQGIDKGLPGIFQNCRIASQLGRIYASTDQNLYYSDDMGQTWINLLEFFNYGSVVHMQNTPIGLYVVQRNTSHIQANTPFFYSENYGSTWVPREATIENGLFFVTQSENKVILHKTKNNILFSDDYGNTIEERGFKDTSDIYIYDVIFNDDKVFAATYSGMFVSGDFGKSWHIHEKFQDRIRFPVEFVAIGNSIVMSSRDGIYRTHNNGEAWVKIETSLDTTINKLEINNNKLWAGTLSGNLYCSVDYGDSWTLKAQFENDISEIFIYKENIFIYVLNEGPFLSTDNGEIWRKITDGLKNINISQFAIVDDYIFCGTASGQKGEYGDAIYRAKLSDFGISSVEEHPCPEIYKFIYPNPADGFVNFRLEITKAGNYTIDIYNLQNSLVKSTQTGILNSGQQEIPVGLGYLAPGMYFMILRDETGEIASREKLIIR